MRRWARWLWGGFAGLAGCGAEAGPPVPAEGLPGSAGGHHEGTAVVPVAEALPAGPGCPSEVRWLPGADLALDSELPRFEIADPRLKGTVLVIEKDSRRAGVYTAGKLDGCWKIALAPGYPAGPKRREGDRKTPEGWYRTSDRSDSSYYHAIAVHYPNEDDVTVGLAEGILSKEEAAAARTALKAGKKPPQASPMGGQILLHGGGSSSDWTLGCVAFEDEDIDAMRAKMAKGMRFDVLILP